ncbi:hypothetical protein EV182_006516 [Spiromyces aspiralis]|uniref:Uncharacterized protein n=1 Tax=Spiromyces aspiralis TaxID=68401 RepID=A0ACC1H9Z5_9FUNG|nr:hypothetical protein EV182_006516 [Spiromyces aspiralis]
MSIILGGCLTALTFAVFFIARDVFGVPSDAGLPSESDEKVGKMETIIYLNISSAPHFTIFSTRLSGFFWENLPSWTFTIAILATQVFAMFISIFGVPKLTTKIGWGWGVSLLAISLVYFMILDIIKVFVFRVWSFELTVKLWPTRKRKRLLAQKKTKIAIQRRVHANVQKLKHVSNLYYAAIAFSELGQQHQQQQ